jgi:hypothetical protein
MCLVIEHSQEHFGAQISWLETFWLAWQAENLASLSAEIR